MSTLVPAEHTSISVFLGGSKHPRPTRTRSAQTLVAFVAIVGAAAVSFCGLAIGNYFLGLEAMFLGFIPYLLWSAYARGGALDIFAPDVGFPVAYILYLFLGSLDLPIETQFGIRLPWIVWLYYIIGLAAYLIGVRLRLPISQTLAATNVKKRFWSEDRFFIVAAGLFCIGLAARVMVIANSGIPFFHADNVQARIEGTGGPLGVMALCMEAAFECFILYHLVKKPRGLSRFLTVSAMLIVLLNGLGSTNRTAVLRISFAAFVVAHYTVKRFRFTTVLIFGLLGASFVSILGTFRDVSEWGEAHIHSLEKQGFTDDTYWLFNGYEALRLPTETFYMTITQIPAFGRYTYGATSLASLTEILPGHRPGPSEILKNTLHLRFVGFGAAATILAPLWCDGGVVGIIVGMFLIGLISGALHRQMLQSRNYLWTLIYAWYVQNAFKAIKDDILPELGFIFVIFLFIVVSIYSSKDDNRGGFRLEGDKRSKRASSSGP